MSTRILAEKDRRDLHTVGRPVIPSALGWWLGHRALSVARLVGGGVLAQLVGADNVGQHRMYCERRACIFEPKVRGKHTESSRTLIFH